MRYVYLHGFASSPQSRKAQAFYAAFNEVGIELEIPALDEGDFSHLTVTAQLQLVTRLLRGEAAVLLGSSLGGYLAALYALYHPEITRLVLLAPAFGFAPLWSDAVGADHVQKWKESGWMDVFHHGDRAPRKIHYGLLEDALLHPANPDFEQPALIFHGVQDAVVPIDLSRRFAATHANAKLVELPSDHELTDVVDRILTLCLPFVIGTARFEVPPAGKLTPDAS